ncbi:periplasmic solute binding protein [Leptolyngbya sp. Heron Island J]|uniref:metal ABC transporter solute-binding protein, Zn/Mn family n=1 Tax=Leptolyngbya sp. Heron Island J TaxID=1385935 RepID=UPI0003B9A3AB|nr:zinc ABC transporter substrate-binding protein [Leptolyngbya sp. Heron Island J]ESA35755.1 periplasmic solute binding protein [Leptolyngbya sp. Heron Island J]
MKLSLRLFTTLAVLGGASALLGHQSAHSQTSPQVVASYSVLCDLTQQIAQDTVDVTCLIEAGKDPHLYNATPADRRAIEDADLVLYGGYGFEPDIIQMVEATDGDAPQIAVSEVAVSEPLLGGHHDHGHGEEGHDDHHDEHDDHGEEGHDEHDEHGHDEHDEHGHDDHSDHSKAGHEGHDHDDHGKEDHDDHSEEDHDEHHDDHSEEEGEPDPHVWHDAENGIAMVHVIEEQLSEVFPENADLYEANAEALIAQLTQLDTWIQQQIDTVPESQRVLVSTHDALGYYADAYGIRIEAALASFSTEARPSAADLRELIDVVEDSSLPSIFIEATSNPGLIEAVSRETDIAISEEPLYADGLGEAGTPAATYTGMLMTNTCTIVTGLGGSCDEAAVQAFLD